MATNLKYFTFLYFFLLMISCNNAPKGDKVKITTTEGDIYIVLYDETPLHHQNFINNIKSGTYKNAPFHRIIKDFMIQAGEIKGRQEFAEDELLPAEIVFPKYFHKRGALAAARWGDDVNPEKKSDSIQFYIVTGEKHTKESLSLLEKERYERLKQNIYRSLQKDMNDSIKVLYKEGKKDEIIKLRANTLDRADKEAKDRKSEIAYTEEQKNIYMEQGGTPHLDTEYTVFGEVYLGMDIVDKINNTETNSADKPIKEIKILNIELVK